MLGQKVVGKTGHCWIICHHVPISSVGCFPPKLHGICAHSAQEHMNQVGKTKWVEVFEGKGAGTGTAAYNSEEEVAQAIATLNGSLGIPALGLGFFVFFVFRTGG